MFQSQVYIDIYTWLWSISSIAQNFLGPFSWKKLGGPAYGFRLNSEKTGGPGPPRPPLGDYIPEL